MTPRTLSLTLLLSLAAALIAAPAHAALSGLKVIKLHSKSQPIGDLRNFGFAVAINEKYAVVGEPAFSLTSPTPGGVHIYNATTGAFIRTLKATVSTPLDHFGCSLALNGNRLLVGAYGSASVQGACYLFDLSTGKLLKQFSSTVLGDRFGEIVAMNDEFLYMSAPGANSTRGTVRVEGINTNFSTTLSDIAGISNERFGSAIYTYGPRVVISTFNGKLFFFKNATAAGTSGNLTGIGFGQVLVGNGFDILTSAPLDDAEASNAGSIQRFSFSNTIAAKRNIGGVAYPSRLLGEIMAQEGNLLVTSIEGGFNGRRLLLFDLLNAEDKLIIEPGDLGTDKPASAIALGAGRLLIGVKTDADLGADTGAAYLVQTFPQPQPFATLANKGTPAPGFANITFDNFGDTSTNFSNHAVTRSTLKGPASNKNKDTGIYAEAPGGGYFESVAKSRQTYFGSLSFGTFGSPIANNPTNSIFPCTLTGPGVTAANKAAVFAESSGVFTLLARAGNPLFPVTQFTVARIGQAAQSSNASRVAIRLDGIVQPGGPTTPLNDSAIALQSYSGINAELLREDTDIDMNLKVAQIAPRVSFHSDVYLLSAAIRQTGDATFNELGVLQKTPLGALSLVALSGWTLPGAPDFQYKSFLGEGGSSTNICLRTIVKGPNINASNNEVILFNRGTGLTTVFQKGGSIINRVLKVWPMGNRLLAQVSIKGPGVTAANNQALYLYQEDGTFSKLLQKGSPLPNSGGLRIGSLQRVEVSNSSGNYAILATLVGAPSSSNQILLAGDVTIGAAADLDEASLRRPVPVLRKGQFITNGYTSNTKVTSLAFANNSTMDATGVGHKGLGYVVSATGSILLRTTLSDGTTRLIRIP